MNLIDVGAIFKVVGCIMSSTKLFKVNLATESHPIEIRFGNIFLSRQNITKNLYYNQPYS